MKIIVLMSLSEYREQIRRVLKEHNVEVFSEVDVTGHMADAITRYGFWHTEKDLPLYSTLYFSLVPDEKAKEIMDDLEKTEWDESMGRPPRAFQVDVERMV